MNGCEARNIKYKRINVFFIIMVPFRCSFPKTHSSRVLRNGKKHRASSKKGKLMGSQNYTAQVGMDGM